MSSHPPICNIYVLVFLSKRFIGVAPTSKPVKVTTTFNLDPSVGSYELQRVSQFREHVHFTIQFREAEFGERKKSFATSNVQHHVRSDIEKDNTGLSRCPSTLSVGLSIFRWIILR